MTTSNLKHRDYLTRNDTSKNMQISSRLCQRTISQPWLILQDVTILFGKYHTLHLVAKCLSVHPGSEGRDSATLSNILELSVPGTLQALTSPLHSWQLGCYFQDMRFSRPSQQQPAVAQAPSASVGQLSQDCHLSSHSFSK